MLSLITGVGAKGQVGEAVAMQLGKRGDTVVIASRSEDEVRAREHELRTAGVDATGYACDLSNAADVTRLAERVRSAHGDRLDALVNLAGGFAQSGPLATSEAESLTRMFQINVATAYLTTRAFLPNIWAARGSIVFFASDAVLDGSKTSGVASYVIAKAGVVALMRSVADESREPGARANALAPAAIRTASNEAAMGSRASYVEREDVAAAVAFLCSHAAAAITGQVIRLRK